MIKDGLLQILDKVYQQKDLDFRGYKESTLKRRIERRLRATKTKSYQQYTEVLDADPSEYIKLIDNLTIQVTEFFRNFEAWQILREQVEHACVISAPIVLARRVRVHEFAEMKQRDDVERRQQARVA